MSTSVYTQGYVLTSDDFVLDESENARGQEYVLRVRDLPDEARPREKLFAGGPEALSVSELLAIVLNTGTKKEGVLSMTSRILKEYGERSIAYEKDPKEIAQKLDVPMVKACQMVACFELGRRFFHKNGRAGAVIRTPKHVFEYLKDIRDLPKEQMRGIYVNSHYRVVHDEIVSIGSLTANIVHPREVFKPAFDYSAAAVIVAHNHPSGSARASQADIAVTRQLIAAGKVLGIDLLDHVIVTKNKFSSIFTEYTL